MLFAKHPSPVDPHDAAAAVERGDLVVVDVREPYERAEAHIPGSRHIPLGELPDRLSELPVDKPVAFICRSGGRSSVAAEAAKQIEQVSDVRGGMLAWSAAGLPVTTYSPSGN